MKLTDDQRKALNHVISLGRAMAKVNDEFGDDGLVTLVSLAADLREAIARFEMSIEPLWMPMKPMDEDPAIKRYIERNGTQS